MMTALSNDLLRRIFAVVIVDEWEKEKYHTAISRVCKRWYHIKRELMDAAARSIQDAEMSEFYRAHNYRERTAWFKVSLGKSAIFPALERCYWAADDAADAEDREQTKLVWQVPRWTDRTKRYMTRSVFKRRRYEVFADEAEKTLEFLHAYEEELEERMRKGAILWLKPFYERVACG